ncbi:tyrosine-type recombinase/integrase [Kribbella deserti]|uniref:Tyrosine-type recombinase/integrase n=1 Tax=Kribbella deserti TaxID=1926257 RepID=A0ABV6QN88_9ACTN
MGHVKDLWMKRDPETGKKVRSARYGRGKRWLARWIAPNGEEDTQAFALKDEALLHISAMETSKAAGTYIDPRVARQTFQEYAERWRADQLHHRKASAVGAELALRVHVYPVIGGVPIGSITRGQVQLVVNTFSKVLAPTTCEVTYGYMATVFRSAVLDRVIERSPCVRINLPEVVKKKVTPLLLEQVTAIYDHMPGRYKNAVEVAAASGLRQGELFGLTVDRLDGACDDLTLVIDRQRDEASTWKPPKTKAGDRKVRLGLHGSRAIWRQLNAYGESRYGHVFATARGSSVSRTLAGDLWRDAADGLGLWERSGWHDLRHYHASKLIRLGLSVTAIADRLGHSDQKETYETYLHLWPDDSERAVIATDMAMAELAFGQAA